ncbi:MAG: hypothetical protein ACD_26C00106G0002 [uncultured bacterium]|nr:MAG: hypothetical protein ACD_26C00106G0002 [uncultured bacterium]
MDSNPKTICLLKYLKALRFYRKRPFIIDFLTFVIIVTGIIYAQIEDRAFVSILTCVLILFAFLDYYIKGSILSMTPLIDKININKILTKSELLTKENPIILVSNNTNDCYHYGYGFLYIKQLDISIVVKIILPEILWIKHYGNEFIFNN